MKLYISKYSDYGTLPDKVFCDNTPGEERKSLDGLEFMARCSEHSPGNGCLSWMDGSETPLNRDEAQEILSGPDWSEEE